MKSALIVVLGFIAYAVISGVVIFIINIEELRKILDLEEDDTALFGAFWVFSILFILFTLVESGTYKLIDFTIKKIKNIPKNI